MAKKLLAGFVACLCVVIIATYSMTSGHTQSPQKKFDMTKIADGLYSFRFMFHRNMVLITKEGVVISDPMNPFAAKMMLAAIKKLTDKPVKYVIYSHNHWDHISGGRIFKALGAKIVQHKLGAKATRPSPRVVPADTLFSGKRHDIKIGGQTIELHYVGPSHGAGMTIIRLPKYKIMHIVDIVTPNRLAFRAMPDFIPHKWIEALKNIEKMDFDRIIPGHGPAVAPKKAVTMQREYVEDLTAAVTNAVKITKNPFAFKKITKLVKNELRPRYGKWAFFEEWMMMNVERITLEQRMGW